MEKIVSICGLLCSDCGAFIATINDDGEKRREVAELWSKEYNANIKAEDINCESCLSDSENVFSHPKVCEIRKCGKEKAVVNCAHCSEYACELLGKFFKMVPEAKQRLDKIKASL
jgi:hypothetical protein